MSTVLARRVARLEASSRYSETRPRDRLRLVVRSIGMTGAATVHRTLCPDGALLEIVRFDNDDCLGGRELNGWIETFPTAIL